MSRASSQPNFEKFSFGAAKINLDQINEESVAGSRKISPNKNFST